MSNAQDIKGVEHLVTTSLLTCYFSRWHCLVTLLSIFPIFGFHRPQFLTWYQTFSGKLRSSPRSPKYLSIYSPGFVLVLSYSRYLLLAQFNFHIRRVRGAPTQSQSFVMDNSRDLESRIFSNFELSKMVSVSFDFIGNERQVNRR